MHHTRVHEDEIHPYTNTVIKIKENNKKKNKESKKKKRKYETYEEESEKWYT